MTGSEQRDSTREERQNAPFASEQRRAVRIYGPTHMFGSQRRNAGQGCTPLIPPHTCVAHTYITQTSPPDGRLPDADKGAMPKTTSHVRAVFNRMGFNDREMVALIGAHALGRCHTDASGYWGPWTNAETTMSNEYFRLLVEEEWTIKKMHNGKKWTGPEQYEDKTGNLMMLPADIALIQDPEFAKIVLEYAKSEDVFFKDFAASFSKLLELGVPFPKAWWKFW